jgi:hypothetical protein
MKKNTITISIIIAILFIINLNIFSQENEKSNYIFLNPKSEKIELLYDKPCGKVVYKIKNDISNESFINLELVDKNDSMFLVIAYQPNYETKKGWIKKSSTLGIYTRNYSNEPIVLYREPNYSKKKYIINNYDFTIMCHVLDFSINNKWIKIRIKSKGRVYEGWIPPEMQCANVYSTCS